MSYPRCSLVLSEAILDDIPALSAMFPRAYHNTPYFKQMMPDTLENDKWWQEAHRIAMLDPKTRFVKVTNQENGEIVAMARWMLPRDDDDDGGPQPGSEEERWPAIPDGCDRSLSDPIFEIMGRSREEFMKDRKHYFLEFMQTVGEYKGRGAGSLMMKYGCDMADKDGLEIYVDASMEGYPVYLKYGFVLKREGILPGGFGYIQRHLVRPAKKHLDDRSD